MIIGTNKGLRKQRRTWWGQLERGLMGNEVRQGDDGVAGMAAMLRVPQGGWEAQAWTDSIRDG